jgi:NAD(P)H-hydrate epimerase
MVAPWQAAVKLSVDFDAALIGPGLAATNLSEEIRNQIRRLWLGSTKPLVVDASALDWVPFGPVPEKYIRVITPHPGEAARLLGCKPEEIQADRVRAVREISKRFSNCWVVLKGHQTLIGRATGDIFVNSTGNPYLAQGGSGDLLAGYLAGLVVQPALQVDPLKTICHAVWQHGLAADRLTSERRNWIIEDLAEVLGYANCP